MTDPTIIQPGALRHKITIQSPNGNQRDAFGEPLSADWTTVLSTRADIESTLTATYKSATGNDALTSQATDIITIRWPGSQVSITPDMRIVWGDQTFQINAIDNVLRRNRVLKIYCMTIDIGSN